MATTKTAKQVQVIATYYHKKEGKLTGVVTYLVRASNGVDTYCTTLIDGKASGCSCPSRSKKGCYHKDQLEQKAQERKEVAQQFSASSVPTWTMQLVTDGKLVAPKHQAKVVPMIKKPIETAPLNGNRGFSILKSAS
jgi:hypothetical protein